MNNNCGNCEYVNVYKEKEPCNSCEKLSKWELVEWKRKELEGKDET